MIPIRVAVSPLLLGALLAGAPSPAPAQGAREAIEAGAAAWADAFNRADAAAVADLYAPDAMVMPPGAEAVSGRDAIRGYWESVIGGGAQTQLKTTAVEQHGDMAIELGAYVSTGPDGEHIDHGKYMVVWKGSDGGWKLHRDIWNSSMSP